MPRDKSPGLKDIKRPFGLRCHSSKIKGIVNLTTIKEKL